MIVTIFLSSFAGPCGIRSDILSGCESIQREDSDSIERRSTNTMATTPVNYVFCLWHMCWYGWWLAWSWWRFHFGTTFPGVRNPSSGTTFHPSTVDWDLWRTLWVAILFSMQVSSATATFAMTFSASMSVVEYYLLKRFPIPYSKYGDWLIMGVELIKKVRTLWL